MSQNQENQTVTEAEQRPSLPYTIVTGVWWPSTKEHILVVHHGMASSNDEAAAFGMDSLLETHPIASGWTGHTSTAYEIPEQIIRSAHDQGALAIMRREGDAGFLHGVIYGAVKETEKGPERWTSMMFAIAPTLAEGTAEGLVMTVKDYPREEGWTDQWAAARRVEDGIVTRAAGLLSVAEAGEG